MPNWTELLRERLDLRGLSPQQQEETVAELAGHLDELFDEYRAQGLNESDAVARTLGEVPDWRALAKTIQSAKREEGNMNNRTKHFWLPGLVSLTAANLILMILIRLGLQPHVYNMRQTAMTVYFPWLAALPLCGALGAYLSRRTGGGRFARVAAGLFPAGIFLAIFGVILLVSSILGTNRFFRLSALAIAVGVWTLLPGASLLLGALPFLSRRRLEEA